MKKKLKLRHSLHVFKGENEAVSSTISELREQFKGCDLEVLKKDTQLVYDVCRHVEKIVSTKKLKKKDIVLKIFTELFPDIDIERVDSDIETGLNNGLIRKTSLLVRVGRTLVNVFLTK